MRRLLGLIAGALAALHASQSRAEDDYGFFYHVSSMTLEPGTRTEAAGPFFVSELRESGPTKAFPPLLSWTKNPDVDTAEFDLLYPVITYDRFGPEYRFQVFQLLSFSGGLSSSNAAPRKSTTLFPFVFIQRSTNALENHTAVLPFYGHIENHFFRDSVDFVLFPLYVESRKRDVRTQNYLLPLVHRRTGNGLFGWQFWPLAGAEQKIPTTRTNLADEVELIPGHKTSFVLWPFYFRNRLGLGSTNEVRQDVLLPLYSIERSPARDSTTYVWPFGLTITDDRAKGYHEVGAPWPLVVFSHGSKTTHRVWPLFSHAANDSMVSDFYLWPVYKFNSSKSEIMERERTRILFYLYSDLKEKKVEAGTTMQRTDLWPLFTARREHDGSERLQILSVLEPVLPNNRGIERNYSPLWSVWRSEKNAKTGVSSKSALWNLYREDKSPTTRKYSLLFGLFHYENSPAGRSWRLFYVPFGKTQPTAAAGKAGKDQ